MEFGKENWRTFDKGIEKEWLLTNGIGGFASSTVIGANTRRYHGLLVASLRPPVNRHLIISKIDETITVGGKKYDLHSYRTPGYTMEGYKNLQRVTVDPLPRFVFSIEDLFIEKKLCMVYGENTVVIVYRIINGGSKSRFSLTPLMNFRDYHHNSCRDHLRFSRSRYKSGIIVKPDFYDLDINVFCSEGEFHELNDCYFMGMEYAVEAERGLHSIEDHYIPGYFDIDILPGEEKNITVIASVEKEIVNVDGPELMAKEEARYRKLVQDAGYRDRLAKELVIAADSFIVYRKSTDAKTIIAGYPWFTDWGRDTMIAFTGLTLVTKRFQDARDILYTFSRYVKDGLIPNMFSDVGQEPAYNTVDAALWYFEAVNKYIEYTGDYTFIKKDIYDALTQILNKYIDGTHFKIKMDKDYLIGAGDEKTQLTWMDAKVGDWVVTPRHGKAVEINALWYNALMVMSKLSAQYGKDTGYYEGLARNVKDSFLKVFWNVQDGYLYDVVTNEYRDGKVRPNQIMAVSLSYPVLEGFQAEKVVRRVWKELYTAYGLRSLSPHDNEYRGIYIGDSYHRDGAYHQGTVWTWPLGQFITAYARVFGSSEKNKSILRRFFEPFRDHLEDACIGSISEIFDGNEPLTPRGCFAQAWSVGEILRAYIESGIYDG
ncbi:MAG: amylo-alpha-1,6-glucosidase [Clostridia bacterium]|nr:amylo-alpha-1,6-glucosidase [Clostridia bacterium]